MPQKGVHGPVTAADVDTWCKWYRQGKSVADISEMAGRNEKTVTAKLKKRGVLLTDEEQRKIRSLAAQGWTAAKISKEIGYPRAAVRCCVREMEVQHGEV